MPDPSTIRHRVVVCFCGAGNAGIRVMDNES
jgi:hypothetical protein